MAYSFITQCPHCQVKFKLTESQLNAAKGSVRCGACLNIFNAKENLTQSHTKQVPIKPAIVLKKEATQRTSLKEPISSPDSNTDNLFEFKQDTMDDIQDDISESLFADLDDQSSELNLPDEKQSEYSSDDDDMHSLFAEAEAGLNNISEESSPDDSSEISLTEENNTNELSDVFSELQSDGSIFNESKTDTSNDLSGLNANSGDSSNDETDHDFIFGVDEPDELEIDEKFLNFDETDANTFNSDALISDNEINEKVIGSDDEVTDESWADSLLDDDTPKENKAVFTSTNLGEGKIEENRVINPNTSKSFYGEHLPANFESDVTRISNGPIKKKHSAKKSINTIGQDTQDLDDLLEKPKGGLLTFISWLFMCLILTSALISQYIYFNFDHLSQSKWRNEVIQLCEKIGCNVPNTISASESLNITKFQATAENKSIKIIFVLNNPQSKMIDFPNLLVQVFDKNNLLLGDHIFESTEYLPSQISSDKKMRANVRTEGSVLIKDLGDNAVKYQLLLAEKP